MTRDTFAVTKGKKPTIDKTLILYVSINVVLHKSVENAQILRQLETQNPVRSSSKAIELLI